MRRPEMVGAAAPASPRPLWRVFAVFLAPMLASNILQSLSGTLNNIYLGQMLGVKALAAVSGFFPVMFFFIAFMIGLGAGASVLIGQAWGAGKVERVRAVAGTTLTVGVAFGLVVAVLGGSFTGTMLRALGTPPARLVCFSAGHGHVARGGRHRHAALHVVDFSRYWTGAHARTHSWLGGFAAAGCGQWRGRHGGVVRCGHDLVGLALGASP